MQMCMEEVFKCRCALQLSSKACLLGLLTCMFFRERGIGMCIYDKKREIVFGVLLTCLLAWKSVIF